MDKSQLNVGLIMLYSSADLVAYQYKLTRQYTNPKASLYLLKVSRHRSIRHCLLAIIIQAPLAVLELLAKELNMSEAKR